MDQEDRKSLVNTASGHKRVPVPTPEGEEERAEDTKDGSLDAEGSSVTRSVLAGDQFEQVRPANTRPRRVEKPLKEDARYHTRERAGVKHDRIKEKCQQLSVLEKLLAANLIGHLRHPQKCETPAEEIGRPKQANLPSRSADQPDGFSPVID